jgi:hypothetical protein
VFANGELIFVRSIGGLDADEPPYILGGQVAHIFNGNVSDQLTCVGFQRPNAQRLNHQVCAFQGSRELVLLPSYVDAATGKDSKKKGANGDNFIFVMSNEIDPVGHLAPQTHQNNLCNTK